MDGNILLSAVYFAMYENTKLLDGYTIKDNMNCTF